MIPVSAVAPRRLSVLKVTINKRGLLRSGERNVRMAYQIPGH